MNIAYLLEIVVQYERVVEPMMLDPSSAESALAASVAIASDPRMQINDAMQMPYQVQFCSLLELCWLMLLACNEPVDAFRLHNAWAIRPWQ